MYKYIHTGEGGKRMNAWATIVPLQCSAFSDLRMTLENPKPK